MGWLENEKVRLRALEPEDLELLYRWENDSEIWKIGNTLAPYSRYALKTYIAEAHRDIYELKQLRLMIEYVATGAAVGMVDLFDFDPYHRRAATGILVDRLYQGCGIGTEAVSLLVEYAFSFLQLHQLYVHVPVAHEESKALFTRCGFVVAGILSDWIMTPDEYADVLVMQRVNR